MNVIVNYPVGKEAMDNLNDKITEFKAILIVESIRRLNVSSDGRIKVVKEMLRKLKSGKYKNSSKEYKIVFRNVQDLIRI